MSVRSAWVAQTYEVRYLRGSRTLHPYWSCSVYKEHDEHDHINTDRNLVGFFFNPILERKNASVNKTNHAIPLDGDLHIPFEQPGWAPVYKRWIALFSREIAIPWISVHKTNHAILWILIYPVDSVIHLSNNSVASHIIKHLITGPKGGILSGNIEVLGNKTNRLP